MSNNTKKTPSHLEVIRSDSKPTAIPEGITEKVIAPRILLEILVFGDISKKAAITRLNKNLQKQLDSHYRKFKQRVRVLFYIDEESKTEEEIHAWFMNNTRSKYYVYANDGKTFSVPEDFIEQQLKAIKSTESALQKLKNLKIMRSPKPIAVLDK